MAKRIRKRKCRNCNSFFPPDPRNAWHQHYCKKPECRKASKAASQKRWLDKEENHDHFRGQANVQRVQEWRKNHPGYWRRKSTGEEKPLQDLLMEKREENQSVERSLPEAPLQDLLNSQPPILIGLIAQLTDSTLQDDIALCARRLQQLGSEILNPPTQRKGKVHDPKEPHLSKPHPKGPEAVQLGGSPPGP